jgi:LysR family transcriptional regulator, nitrogen assimilation regulatory protein
MTADATSLRQLRYFVAAVDSGSISQAAIALSIAQPAVGQQISELEANLGATLLARTARGVRPTEIGAIVYAQAQAVLRQVGQLPLLARAAPRTVAGTVSLGLISSLAARLTVPLVAACRERFPQVRLRIVEGTSVTIREFVNTMRVDVGLVFESAAAPGVVRRPLFEQRLFALELAGTEKSDAVSLAELAGRPLVLPSAPNTIRGAIDRAFLARGLQPDIVAETSSLSGLFGTVRAGLGTAILPMGEIPVGINADGLRIRLIRPQICLTASTILSALTPPETPAHAIHELLCALVLAQVSVSGAWRGASLVLK